MATTPDTIYAKQFGDTVSLLVQQKGSRLGNTVMLKTGVRGEECFMEQVGSIVASDITGRAQPTTLTETPHYRRRIALVGSYVNPFVDPNDLVKMVVDPTSAYVQNAVAAMGRLRDDRIIAAATATAYTGKAGTTTVSFPTATQQVASGSTGMTVAKWLAGLEILNAADVDPSEEKFLIISAGQLTDLLNSTEIKDVDYNSVKALVRGEVDSFLGCKVIRSQRLGTVSGERGVLLYVRSGIGLAISEEVVSNIDVRPDLNYAKQLYFRMHIGASRLEEEKVVRILCTE